MVGANGLEQQIAKSLGGYRRRERDETYSLEGKYWERKKQSRG